MKKPTPFIKMSLLAALVLILFSYGCKKDEDKPATVKEKVVGKWTFEKIDYVDFINGERDEYSEPALPGDYFDFRSDGKMTVHIDGDEDEGTWSLVNDNKIQLSATDITDQITLDIKTLTNSNLVLYGKETDGSNYFEYTLYLKK
jgi:hypothetical protein